MKWEPKEVLQLTCWSEPEDPCGKRSAGARGHWMRLFSCAVLLRAASEPENDGHLGDGQESTIIQLVDSAIKLGKDSSIAALSFLCWRMQRCAPQECIRPYFAVAILLLSVSLGKCDEPLAHYLIGAGNSGVVAVDKLFARGRLFGKWKSISRTILVESIHSNIEVKHFGERLIVEKYK